MNDRKFYPEDGEYHYAVKRFAAFLKERYGVPVYYAKMYQHSCRIQEIYVNGGTAYKLFVKYQQDLINRTAVRLPSTSPANAVWSLERLYGEWKQIDRYI